GDEGWRDRRSRRHRRSAAPSLPRLHEKAHRLRARARPGRRLPRSRPPAVCRRPAMTSAIVVTDLVKTFGGKRTLFRGTSHAVQAVKTVSFELRQNETLAIVGESGSGKSTIARMLVGLETPTSGSITIGGRPYDALRAEGSRKFGRMIQYVFQDPVASLN